jgi:hypothetical protein
MGSAARPGTRPSRAWIAVLAGVFLLALAFRLWAFARLSAPPNLLVQLSADAESYWNWSGYLRAHGPLGMHPFFLGPLYPYLLFALRCIAGDSIPNVLLIQTIAGACGVVLLADAARRLTDARIGAMIGVFMAGYSMAVFMDNLVLMESPLFVLECLLVWLIVRCDWSGAPLRSFAVMGSIVGLLALGRATSLLLLAPLLYGIAASPARGVERMRRAFATVAAAVLLAVPVAVRHRVLVGEWIPYTYNSGLNLYVGNGAGATGSSRMITGEHPFVSLDGVEADGGTEGDGRSYVRDSLGLVLGPGASSRWWRDRAIADMRRDPGAAAALMIKKLRLLWSWRELYQLYSLDSYRPIVGLLGWPLIGSFVVLGPLALAGLGSAWGGGLSRRVVMLSVIAATAGPVIFFVIDRYRIHLVPWCAALAAIALHRILGPGNPRRRRSTLAGAALGMVIVAWPSLPLRDDRAAWETRVDLADAWLKSGRPDLAVEFYAGADSIVLAGHLPGSWSDEGRRARASAAAGYASALAETGRTDAAIDQYEMSLALVPEWKIVSVELAILYLREDRDDRALHLLASAGFDSVGASSMLLQMALQSIAAGDTAGAERCLRFATTLDPRNEAAWVGLMRVRILGGRAGPAAEVLADARRAGIRPAVAELHAGWIALAAGDTDTARGWLDHVDSRAETDPTLQPLVRYLRSVAPSTIRSTASSPTGSKSR